MQFVLRTNEPRTGSHKFDRDVCVCVCNDRETQTIRATNEDVLCAAFVIVFLGVASSLLPAVEI